MKASTYNAIREELQKASHGLAHASAYMTEGDGTWLELSERVEQIMAILADIRSDVGEVPLCG